MTTSIKLNYHDYITSPEWRSRHPVFLKAANYRCAAFPWVKVGRGKRYNCHHTTYQHLGRETYWLDVLCLSPFAHDHIVHGLLSGWKRPSQQRYYPNAAQSLFHAWCRLPAFVKYGAIALAFFAIGYAVYGVLGGGVGLLVVLLILH